MTQRTQTDARFGRPIPGPGRSPQSGPPLGPGQPAQQRRPRRPTRGRREGDGSRPRPPRESKAKVAVIGFLAAALLLAAITAVLTQGLRSDDAPQTTISIAADAALGEPVREGTFEFTVTGWECGIKQVGTEVISATPRGQYCKVLLTVTNIGDQPKAFLDGNQHAYNEAGEKYRADTGAGLYLPDRDKGWLVDDIKAGTSVSGGILFDLPEGETIAIVELHESAFSPGVKVDVRRTAEPPTTADPSSEPSSDPSASGAPAQ